MGLAGVLGMKLSGGGRRKRYWVFFATHGAGLLLLLAPLRRALGVLLGLRPPPTRPDGVVDLEPEQWHRVPDPTLPNRRNNERGHR